MTFTHNYLTQEFPSKTNRNVNVINDTCTILALYSMCNMYDNWFHLS